MKVKLKIPLGIAIFAILVRIPCLFGDFVFDDRPAILNNRDIFNTNSLWTEIFKNDFWGSDLQSKTSHKSYRPLTTLTFRINGIFTKSPKIFHVINVLIHSLNCVLVYNLLRRFSKSNLSVFASLIFSCHPLHSEAVCGIVGRADLLWSMFALISLLVPKNHLAIITLSIISILCKEQGIMVIPMVLALQLTDKTYRKLSKLVKTFCIYGPIVLMILFARLKIMNFETPKFQEGDNPAGFMDSKILRTINFQYISALNFWLMILPDWLCYDWAMGCVPLIEDLTDFRIISILLLWILMIALVFKRQFKALILLILPFIPSSNLLVLVGFVIAERNLYMSLLGYCILITNGFGYLNKKYPKFATRMMLLVLTLFSTKSLIRSTEWQSEEKLFTSGLKVCPNNAKVHYNMAKIQENSTLSEAYYRKALELWPNYEHALNNLGNLVKTNGRLIEAEKLFEKALKISPKFAACWMNLAIVQSSLNKLEQAEFSYIRALELKDPYPDCHFNLGTLYLKLKFSEKALKEFEIAIAQNPKHFGAHANLVILLDELQMFELAKQRAKEALKVFPEKPDFHFHLANIYGKTNNFVEAEKAFEIVIQMNPNDSIYYVNFGVLYHRWKKLDKAKTMYENALKINPKNSSARKNLNSIIK